MNRVTQPPVSTIFSFVLVDDIDENRFLLSKTLLRKYPQCLIVECLDSSAAVAAARRETPAAIIVHRTLDLDGPAVIRLLREVSASTPIIMVSGRESCPEALAAGANAFLNYDSWGRIGTVVEEVLSPSYVKALTRTPFKAQGDFLGQRTAASKSRD